MNLKKISVTVLPALLIIQGLIFYWPGENNSQSKYKYVGANTCVGVCHKSEEQGNQFVIWNKSKHASAYRTLQTPKADSIALAKGYTTPAAETQNCIKCHTLGVDIDESEFLGSFDLSQGVQCESCHGPGSEYKKLEVMKDPEQSMAKGLIVHMEREKFCTNCHNPESPTYFEFDYDPMWEMIAHPKPK
jgi:excinuclease UvrABC ATPase subunit